MAAAPPVDRSVLAGRIQGFGNINPPALEEETGTTIAKKAAGRLGDMIGEEVMLTVEDFREKGAVGAVRDAVYDAGDILIDGVTGIFGWIRGDPPPEEDAAATEAATHALSNGPSGAAYGVSQASPTGGINAVWVMPEDADPAALASLAQQAGGLSAQQQDPRVPKNIQPYQPPPSSDSFTGAPTRSPNQMAGGITIAPYEPAPYGLVTESAPAFAPTAGQSALQQGRWGPGGYSSTSGGSSSSASRAAGAGSAGSKAFVERIAKGEVLVGPDAAKRLVSQCNANKTSARQLGELVCERIRRLYLGLDGGDPADADEALAHLLGLADALATMDSDFACEVVKNIRDGAFEELSSLRSSAKHKDAAEPMLQRLERKAEPSVSDLLDGDGHAAASSGSAAEPSVSDLLDGDGHAAASGSAADAAQADLLGAADATDVTAPLEADLLAVDTLASNAGSDVASLDPMLAPAAPEPASTGSSLLAGLTLDSSAEPAPAETASLNAVDGTPVNAADAAGAAALDALASESSKREKSDAFDFVGGELSKAQSQA